MMAGSYHSRISLAFEPPTVSKAAGVKLLPILRDMMTKQDARAFKYGSWFCSLREDLTPGFSLNVNYSCGMVELVGERAF
jgi:hypothetical protein